MCTVPPETPICELLGDFARYNIGAMVVVENDAVVGIITERDVVRSLNHRGPSILADTARNLMTTEVATCLPSDTVHSLAETMTDRRVRHLPVVEDGRLVGIVSIGDIVKSRLDELQDERDQLASYIHRG
ncbi:CBS domain-containing protein [Rhodococcus coprophilus]|nr:CBS domain-containing protein [Rhodococcus coprophilus]